MKYISLDIETTGLSLDSQILQIGVVVDDLSWPDFVGDGPYGGRPYFETEIRQSIVTGEPYALWMNANILKKIATDFSNLPDCEAADILLRDFLVLHFSTPAEGASSIKVPVAGKNAASFDIPIMKNEGYELSTELFSHRVVDPAMLYWEKGDEGSPSLSKCLQRAGLASEVAHTACADAWQVIQLIRHKLCYKV